MRLDLESDSDLLLLLAETRKAANAAAEMLLTNRQPPQAVRELVETVHGTCDENVSKALALVPPALRPSCAKGCSWCCYEPVQVLVPEVIVIADYVLAEPSIDTEAVRSSARKLAGSRMVADPHEGAQAGAPCPLLHEGLCAVYPVRPIVCRRLFSHQPETCRSGHEHPETVPGIPVNRRAYMVGIAATLAFQETLGRLGLEVGLVELARGLDIALSGHTLAERWLRDKKRFARIWWRDAG